MSQSSANMDSTLWAYVKRFSDNGDGWNFLGQAMPWTGKFKIERKDLDEFWTLYSDTLEHYDKLGNQFISGISERSQEYLPLMIDADLELTIEPGLDLTEKLYTKEEVDTVIKVIRRVLREVSRDFKARNSVCIVLEKPAPYVSGEKLKGGFHLHFPRYWVRNCDHDLHIFPRIKKMLNTEFKGLFSKLKIDNTGDVLDTTVGKAWLLYGGCKSEKSGSYRFTRVVDQDGDETTLSAALNGYKLFNAQEEEIKIEDGRWEYYLPRILSTHPANQTPTAMKTNLEWASEVKLSTAKQRTTKHELINVVEAMKLAAELLPMISPRRADHYADWWEMGVVLYCVGDGCKEALDLWIEFSKRTDRNNFDEAYCVYQWNKMVNTGRYSIGSLRHFAGIDSPSEYDSWKRKKLGSRVKDVLIGGHTALAQMLHDMYANVFVCADPEKGIWYMFRNHRWHRIRKATALRKKIKQDLVQRFVEEQRRLYAALGQHDDVDQEDLNKRIKEVGTILKNLNTAPFKDNIIKEAVDLFHDENIDFIEKLDDNINLIGFDNGVFDVQSMTFREGRPDDYISKSTGYDYQEFTDDDPRVMEIKDFFTKVFPSAELRRFFLEYAAQLLKGGNFNKLFLNMVGSGDNAKSVTVELIEKMLGSYAVKFPTSLITGKRTQSSGAAPEVIRSIGARFATMQEPDNKDVINIGILKELTGNDSMFARGLYSEGREFKPMFKLGLVTNKLVHLTGNDTAIWNRILVLPFEACFPKDSNKVPVLFEDQMKQKTFYRDANFSEKIPCMRQPLMWLLIQKLKEVKLKGPSAIPKRVTEETEKYRQNNDAFLQFTKESVMEIADHTKGISLTEVYAAFKVWFVDTFPNMKVPAKNDLRDDLSAKWGPPNEAAIWPGRKIKTNKDFIESGDAKIVKPLGQDEQLEHKIEESKVDIGDGFPPAQSKILHKIVTPRMPIREAEVEEVKEHKEADADPDNYSEDEEDDEDDDSDDEDEYTKYERAERHRKLLKKRVGPLRAL
jgi:P4 family phage/plasmid primase-like protien